MEDNKKIDKRKITSKTNMQKARQAKLEQLKKKKEDKNNTKEYEICEDNNDSSSDSDTETDDEVIIVKGKKKDKKVDKSKMNEIEKLNAEVNELKNTLQNLKVRKKKTKPKKQVIKVVNQQPPKQNDPKINGLKERILVNF